ncbi:hypothetical protein BDN70DRAFT_998123 [Pholiota conissans]|uniref:Heterokaryon incompatibility domain-containing protein n=1 Tax=Pholiota conissans TaxID=109636 RepID=A0A9P5YRF6_9AGAR|nr:hypothetical protein BDN70DRAFT_998123 [Pholiota conissans]
MIADVYGGAVTGDDIPHRTFLNKYSLVPRRLSTPRTPDPMLYKRFLTLLQEHVANKMPIWLLRIKPHESYLEISLIDRGDIYAHLKEAIEAKIYGMDFPPLRTYSGSLETEETIEQLISKCARYAILSHKWLQGRPGEITYDHWKEGLFDPKSAGYEKLVNFCRTAWNDYGITLAWMDTICINKDSSSELDESIRSMYAWYKRSHELLAPERLKFYGADWTKLESLGVNDKDSLITYIEQATTISHAEITNVACTPFSRRMQWAASRKVTREEDMAYSLMGIFNMSISIAYGEGADRAFRRLLKEILTSTSRGVLDLFNWAGDHTQRHTFLLPSSPKHYVQRSTEISLHQITPLDHISLTSRGIWIPVILMPGISVDAQNPQYKFIGGYGAIVKVSWLTRFRLPVPTTYCLLEKKVSGPDGLDRPWAQLTFAVFNFQHCSCSVSGEMETPGIRLQSTCIAIVLQCSEHAGKVTGNQRYHTLPTAKPVVFKLGSDPKMKPILSDIPPNDADTNEKDFIIPRDQLENHGMQLVSIYL